MLILGASVLDKSSSSLITQVVSLYPCKLFERSEDFRDNYVYSKFCQIYIPNTETVIVVLWNSRYLEKNPKHWHPNHNLVVKEIENVNKIKLALFMNHTMNFQDFPERNRRRTELVLEMKRILEELHIRYDLLPQDVHLNDSRTSTETSKWGSL